MTMKISMLAVLCCILPVMSLAQLRVGFYDNSCPQAEAIVRQAVQSHFRNDRSITAALLRMHFHDCFVRGCDASILIDSTPQKSSEKAAGPNLSVRGYELIDEVKKQLEIACPKTVSCSDVVTLATRDSVALAGGPSYKVPTGRRDGLDSNADEVNLPGPQLSVKQTLEFFKAKNMSLKEMVALLGAHTIGITHCSFIQDRLFDFQGTRRPDGSMDSALLAKLSSTCQVTGAIDPPVFLDQNTSFVLDNQFYKEVMKKRGVLKIDQNLASDPSSAPIVASFASNENLFRQNFVDAMIKMASLEVLVGSAGEIRENCRVFNKQPSTPIPRVPVKSTPKGRGNSRRSGRRKSRRNSTFFFRGMSRH